MKQFLNEDTYTTDLANTNTYDDKEIAENADIAHYAAIGRGYITPPGGTIYEVELEDDDNKQSLKEARMVRMMMEAQNDVMGIKNTRKEAKQMENKKQDLFESILKGWNGKATRLIK